MHVSDLPILSGMLRVLIRLVSQLINLLRGKAELSDAIKQNAI